MNNVFFSLIDSQDSTDDFTTFLNQFHSSDYQISFDGMWKHYHVKNTSLPQAGWKGHLAAMPADKEKIFAIAFEILVKQKCEFKVTRSNQVYQALADPHAPVAEANKFITFYPANAQKFRQVTKQLFDALKGFNAPEIFTDYQLPKNSPVQFRYGAFKELKKWDKQKQAYIQLMKLPTGEIVIDDRESIFSIPEGVNLPFTAEDARWVENVDSSNEENKLDTYKFEAILSQKNKGDVYLASQGKKKVAIKEVNPFVQNKKGSQSAQQLLANEANYLTKLQETNFVPGLLDTFCVEDKKFEVVSYLDGISLDSPIANVKKKEIIIALCKTVYEFHSRNLVIVDLTNNNFIYKDGQCYLIDLEYVRNKHDLRPREGYTPYYVPLQSRLAAPTQEEDVFSLAVTILGILFNTVPKYQAKSLESAAEALKTQIYVQCQLNPADAELLHLAAYLLDIAVGVQAYEPELLLHLADLTSNQVQVSLASNQQISTLLQKQKSAWQAKYPDLKDANGLLVKTWQSTDFSEQTSQLALQNGILSVARVLDRVALTPTKLKQVLEVNRSFDHSESYLFGSSSVIWELVYEYQTGLLPFNTLEQAIKTVVDSWNKRERELDFALGLSGKLYTLIFALLAEPKLSYLQDDALRLHKQLKRALSQELDVYNLQAAGFAHGLAGKAHTLLISSIYFRDETGLKKALGHLKYLNELLENRIQLNPEFTSQMQLSWCEGVSGIALALMRSQYILGDKIKFSSLTFARKYLTKHYAILESNLCHGKESVIGYLADLACRYPSPALERVINLLVNFELATGKLDQTEQVKFFDETGYTSNLDYGTGQAGILDTCLKAVAGQERLFYLTSKQESILKNKLIALNIKF